MIKVNSQELESLIKSYVNGPEIQTPLIVLFGMYEEEIALGYIKNIFGDSNSWKITFDDDDPRPDIPYCLYDVYLGNENSNRILRNCITIAARIHRPVFCFISLDYADTLPADIIKDVEVYAFGK